jgi:hypothetical protein
MLHPLSHNLQPQWKITRHTRADIHRANPFIDSKEVAVRKKCPQLRAKGIFSDGEGRQLYSPITPEVAILIIEPDRVKVAPPVIVSDITAPTAILVSHEPLPVLSPDRVENST